MKPSEVEGGDLRGLARQGNRAKEKGRRKASLSQLTCEGSSSSGAEDSAPVGPAEAVTFGAFVTDVARFKVTFHALFHGTALEVLEAIRTISLDEPSIRISQTLVDSRTTTQVST